MSEEVEAAAAAAAEPKTDETIDPEGGKGEGNEEEEGEVSEYAVAGETEEQEVTAPIDQNDTADTLEKPVEGKEAAPFNNNNDDDGDEEEDKNGDEDEADEETTEAETTAEKGEKEAPTDFEDPSTAPESDETTEENETTKLELPPMENYKSITEKERKDIHAKLKAYESRRRMTYTNKLESSSLYWRAFRSLLDASIFETSRAERLVSGAAKANRAFAESMKASYEDIFLDDKNQVVTDPKKQKRLLDMRAQQDYVGAPKAGDSKKKVQDMEAKRKNENNLSAVIDTQNAMANKFNQNADQLETEIVAEIQVLRRELEAKVADIKILGDQILAELEQVEKEVADAWDAYYASAVDALRTGTVKQRVTRKPGSPTSDEDLIDNCTDVWLVEMHYRVVVSYQSTAWEKASTELTSLFGAMKETECQRRIDLREYMVAFMQRQERLFNALPSIHTAVLQELVGRDMDRGALESSVQAAIRKRAEKLQREDLKHKDSSKSSGAPGKEAGKEGGFSLGSPLLSDLICSAKVVERKNFGMMSTWKVCLAVITSDAYMHMFDIPSSRVSKGSAPEVALQSLVPKVHIPSADSVRQGKSNFIKGWCEHLTPAESLNLHNCKLVFGFDGSTLEVQETVAATGASKVFGKTTTRKLTLRTVSKLEAQDLMVGVTSLQGAV